MPDSFIFSLYYPLNIQNLLYIPNPKRRLDKQMEIDDNIRQMYTSSNKNEKEETCLTSD